MEKLLTRQGIKRYFGAQCLIEARPSLQLSEKSVLVEKAVLGPMSPHTVLFKRSYSLPERIRIFFSLGKNCLPYSLETSMSISINNRFDLDNTYFLILHSRSLNEHETPCRGHLY